MFYRVLSNGKSETTNQRTGKLIGANAIFMPTAIGSIENGNFLGESNSLISVLMDETVMLKGNGVSRQYEKDILTRAETYQITKAEKFARLNKMLLLHEYITDMEGNWKVKIWEWK